MAIAGGPSVSDNTTNHVDVLLATLVVKIGEISAKVGAATAEATSRVVVGSNAADTAKLQADLAELKAGLAALHETLHALPPTVKDGHKGLTAQLSHLEKIVQERITDVSQRVDRQHGVLAAYVEKAGGPAATRALEAALEHQLGKLAISIEARIGAASESSTAAVGRQFSDSDAALARRLGALLQQLESGEEKTRSAVADRADWSVKQVQGSQGAAFDALNARLDRLTEAVEGMQVSAKWGSMGTHYAKLMPSSDNRLPQARFMSSLGGLAGQQAKDTADLRAAAAAAESAAAKQFASLASALDHARTSQAAAAQQLAAVSKHAEGGRADSQAVLDKVDGLVKQALPRMLAEAQKPVLDAHAASSDQALKHTQKLLGAAAAEQSVAAAKAAELHTASLQGHHQVVIADVKAVVEAALNEHSQAAARFAAAASAESSAQVSSVVRCERGVSRTILACLHPSSLRRASLCRRSSSQVHLKSASPL
jgi:hypothetical protein